MSISRRRFLKGSLATGTFVLSGMKASAQVAGANNRVRVAVAGINGRGGSHINAYRDMVDVELAYLVDPDSRLFDSRVKAATEKGAPAPRTVQDIRRVLDDKDVDVVSIATPNHWHALMTIWACEAGKDVYVEKPCSHNIHEGRIAVEMARKHRRIVQHGTQSRSSGSWSNAVAAVKAGKYGRLLISRGLCYKTGGGDSTRGDIGFAQPKAPPSELDFDIWLGPAPRQAYHENLVHYRWHWFWDFGNGDIGNQGVHEMDLARWAVGGTLPRSVISVGGRFGPKDQGQSANEQIAVFDYGDTQLIFEERGLESPKYLGHGVGVIYHLEAGTIRGPKAMFYEHGSDTGQAIPDMEAAQGPGDGDHFRNFVAAVRSRKVSDLNANVLEGHYSAALCHLANASYRTGEEVPFNTRTKAFGDNKEAYETFGRMEEQLKGNGFTLDSMKYRLGRKLMVDSRTELTNDAEANKILTGTYREPFVVPEAVA